MSIQLERAGIFKARPMAWGLQKSDQTQSVAVGIEFAIVAMLDNGAWQDWTQYEEHTITGYFYVVKRDGTINTRTVENLVQALGWNGDLSSVLAPPPDRVVQITVNAEEYEGKIRHKVQWINPEDYTPKPVFIEAGEVQTLQNRFGSLLRAAAASVKPAPAPVPRPAASKKPEDDLPF